MPTSLESVRREDLRAWQRDVPGCAAIADLTAREEGCCAGVVVRMRLEPGGPTSAEIDDGTGRLEARWYAASSLAGIEVGAAVRLRGTVTVEDDLPTVREPRWTLIAGPYHPARPSHPATGWEPARISA